MPRLSEQPFMHSGVTATGCTFGRFVEIGENSRILESDFGDYSYTDRFADIAYSSIGKFANIAAFVRINPSPHPYERASLHHFMYRASYYWDKETDDAAFFDWRRAQRCSIGHDSWIGHGALVMKHVRIGDGAVVASGAVVTKDVPDYAIVAGVPAKFLKWRHPERIASRLKALAWWEWNHAKLHEALPDFRNLSAEAFLEKYERATEP